MQADIEGLVYGYPLRRGEHDVQALSTSIGVASGFGATLGASVGSGTAVGVSVGFPVGAGSAGGTVVLGAVSVSTGVSTTGEFSLFPFSCAFGLA